MRKPRKIKLAQDEWFSTRSGALMKRYINDRSGLLWTAWLKREYEAYRDN